MAAIVTARHWLNKCQYIAELQSDDLGAVLAIVTINEAGEIIKVVTFEKAEEET